MRKEPFEVPDDELEVEQAGTGGEDVFILMDGESVPLKIPDDTDGEEDHDNVDYD